MKPPAASPGRAEKPQLPAPAPPGLARLLLSKSRRGGRSRRAPATSPMFVSRGRSRAADGEPSSPKVTCIGQVRMRKGKKGKKNAAAKAAAAAAPEKGAKGYCRCLKKAFLCGGLFEFDSRRRRQQKAPSPEVVERSRRSPWVFSSRDVAVAAAPKAAAAADPRSGIQGEDDEEEEMTVGVGVFGSIGREEGEKMGVGGGCGSEEEDGEDEREAQLVSSATTTPPKNALLLMRCRSAPQNRTSPLTSRFPAAAPAPSPSPTRDALAAVAFEIAASPSPSPSPRKPEKASPSPRRKPSAEKVSLLAGEDEERQGGSAAAPEQDPRLIGGQEETEEEEEDDEFEEEEDSMRCSSARPLVLQRCKSEPATTAAAKMATGGAGAEGSTAGCFWAHGGSSGRRRHAPPGAGAPVALAGH